VSEVKGMLFGSAGRETSLSAVVAESKNCSFGVSTTFELKNVTTVSYNNGI
jgi:hypothetical protein